MRSIRTRQVKAGDCRAAYGGRRHRGSCHADVAEGGGPHTAPKFFSKRGVIRALQEDHDGAGEGKLIDTINVAPRIAAVLRTGLTTLEQLQTVYSLRDMYDLIEVAAVDAYNRRVMAEIEATKTKRETV